MHKEGRAYPLHLIVLDILGIRSFCIGAPVEPGIVTAGGPFGQVLHTVHRGGYLKVRSF